MIEELLFWLSITMIGFSVYFLYNFIYKIRNKNIHYLWSLLAFILSFFLAIFGIYAHNIITIVDISLEIQTGMILYFFAGCFILIVIDFSQRMVEKLENNKEKFNIEKNKFKKENRFLHAETKEQNIELEKKVNELENAKSGMINILEDVNAQKEELTISEKELKKFTLQLKSNNKKLLNLDKEKDQFTSITAHELKTPLASIHGFTQLLKNPKIINDKEKRDKYMNIILQDTERLSKLITDILDISRMDIGNLKFYFEEINLKEFIDKINHETSSIFKNKNIKYSFIVDKNAPKTIFIDTNRLSQVITNLINNAIHYTNEKGHIQVKVIDKGSNVLFSVIDNGEGIPKENLKSIFERFFQVDSWLTRKIGGSGLGLAISKGLISAMGGKIWVESVVGKGSTFYFTVPKKSKKESKEGVEKYIKIFDEKNKNANTKKIAIPN